MKLFSTMMAGFELRRGDKQKFNDIPGTSNEMLRLSLSLSLSLALSIPEASLQRATWRSLVTRFSASAIPRSFCSSGKHPPLPRDVMTRDTLITTFSRRVMRFDISIRRWFRN
jgi:hypothetical protein